MADAIGNVRVTFTGSAGGLVDSVNKSVSSLDGMRTSQRNAAAAFSSSASSSFQAQHSITQSVQASSAAMRDAAKITRDTRTPAEQYAETIRKLDAYLSRGLLTQEVYSRAVAKAEKDMRAAEVAGESLSAAMTRTGMVFTAVTSAAQAAGDAVSAIAKAGSSVISFGEDVARATAEIAAATTAWRIFSAVTSAFKTPEGLFGIATGLSRALLVIKLGEVALGQLGIEAEGAASFATKATLAFGAFKAAMALGLDAKIAPMVQAFGAALPAALARVGISAAATQASLAALGAVGNAVGTRLASVALMSIPGFGQLAATAFLVGKAMLSARDRAYEMAAEITAGNTTVDDLAASVGQIQAAQIDNLAFAMEEATASVERSRQSLSGLADVFASPFVGAFASLTSGFSGLRDGLSGIVEGITSVASPIAEVIAPAATLLAVVAEGAMKLVGALGEAFGVILKVAGALTRTLLAPAIAGLTNLVDTIRSGMNAAFEFIGSRIDFVTNKLQAFYAFMSNVPVIGGAFASGAATLQPVPSTTTNDVAANVDLANNQAEALRNAAREEEQAAKSIAAAIRSQESALSVAISKAEDFGQTGFEAAIKYQEQLRRLEQQLEAGILNETSFGDAAQQAKKEFDAQIDSLEKVARAAGDISKAIEKASETGKDLGAAATPIRDAFKTAAADIKSQLEQGLLTPEEASKAMADSVAAMNDQLKRLGEDQGFAKKIRDSLKTEVAKVNDELASIDLNTTLSAEEKEKAKTQVRDKFTSGLPGAAEKDAADKFRDGQNKLRDALVAGLIGTDEFAERQEKLRDDLENSVSDLKDKQERNKQPDRRAVGAVDVNSSEGASTFFKLLRGQDDPTKKQLDEMRRQTRLLERVAEADAEVVQI